MPLELELTESQTQILEHTLGAGKEVAKRDRGYRNYFMTYENSDNFEDLIILTQLGMMMHTPPSPGSIFGDGHYFHATKLGAEKIGLHKAGIKRAGL